MTISKDHTKETCFVPFPSSVNSHNTHNCCHSLPSSRSTSHESEICWTFLFLLFCVFLTFLILHGVQNLGILELWRINWREKWRGCFKEPCVFNRGPVLWVLILPPAWGLWNGANLCIWYDLLHELTLKCFPGSFWGFLAWLSVTMHAGVCINAHICCTPIQLLSLLPCPPIAWAHFPLSSSAVFYWELWRLQHRLPYKTSTFCT